MVRKRSAPPRSSARTSARTTSPGSSPGSTLGWTIAALALVLLGVLLVQSGGVARPFFADDYLFLEQVRGRGVFAALASHDPIGNFVRPVSRAAWFALLGRISDESPVAFHLANLVVFAGVLLLLFDLVRRRLGVLAAVAAAAFVGLHYAADVPLRWASGSQDLLAVGFALLAIDLHVRGRAWPAAVALALALLSKEVAAGAVVIAMLATHAFGTPWRATLRRAAPLLGVTAAWAVAWVLAARSGAAARPQFHPTDLAAAFAHLLQVAVGLEFRLGKSPFGHWSAGALLPAGLAVAAGFLAMRGQGRRVRAVPGAERRTMLVVGLAWAAVGTLPLSPVMPIWSAYFYLWALCGVAVLLAVAIVSLPRAVGIAGLGALVLLSAEARGLDEFAIRDDSWSRQSHVDRFYLERSLTTIARYLHDLRAARPTLPHRSTVFYGNVPMSIGWQTANGPVLRWAYRDSSLRSYYYSEFTRERAARGPVFFFAAEKGGLVDHSGSPDVLIAFGTSMAMAGKERQALDVLDMVQAVGDHARFVRAWRGWLRWDLGDTIGGARELEAAGMHPARGHPADAEARVQAAPDSMRRALVLAQMRNQAALDPWVEARLVPALLAIQHPYEAVLSAFAFRVLAPDDPNAWRSWAIVLRQSRDYEPGLAALDHYIAMLAARGERNPDAESDRVLLERAIRGDLAAAALRGDTAAATAPRPALVR